MVWFAGPAWLELTGLSIKTTKTPAITTAVTAKTAIKTIIGVEIGLFDVDDAAGGAGGGEAKMITWVPHF